MEKASFISWILPLATSTWHNPGVLQIFKPKLSTPDEFPFLEVKRNIFGLSKLM
jgi:hypothetical protein